MSLNKNDTLDVGLEKTDTIYISCRIVPLPNYDNKDAQLYVRATYPPLHPYKFHNDQKYNSCTNGTP